MNQNIRDQFMIKINNMSNIIGFVIYFIILMIISYIMFIIILLIFNPEFYNSDGSINWLTPLWVVVGIYLFLVIFMVIIVECMA